VKNGERNELWDNIGTARMSPTINDLGIRGIDFEERSQRKNGISGNATSMTKLRNKNGTVKQMLGRNVSMMKACGEKPS
jgi:hypothetical protein